MAWLAGAALLSYAFGWQVVTLESAAANWCIWALGALAVECYFGFVKLPDWCYNWRLAVLLAVAAGILAYANYWAQEVGGFAGGAKFLMQPLWGVASFIVINRAVRHEAFWAARAAATRWVKALMWLGLVSYSLYLTHELVFHLEGERPWLTVPLALLVAWIFFQFFEKPFISAPTTRPAAPREELTPALHNTQPA